MVTVLWFSFLIQKKNPRRSSHSCPAKLSGKQISPTASSCLCPPWLAQSGARKSTGKRENAGRLTGVVSHRELLCLWLPFSEALRGAETMALLRSCVPSTSSTAGDG